MFRQLLPSLLMLSEDGGVVTVTPLPSSLSTLSKHALSFVDHVTRSMQEQVHMPLLKLIQHICTKIPDRAEYRNKMAVVSVESVYSGLLYSGHSKNVLIRGVTSFQGSIQWTHSNPGTLGTSRSVLIRGVTSFQGSIQWAHSNPGTLGTSRSVLIRGVASFQGWNCTRKHTLGHFE